MRPNFFSLTWGKSQIFDNVMFQNSNQTVCNWINLVTMALFFWAWNIKIKRPLHTPMKSGCKASAQYSSPARNKRITAQPQCSILSVPPCNSSHYISSLYSSLVQYTSHIQSSTNCRGASTHPWGMFPKEWNYIYLTADISISQPLQLLFTTYTTQHVYYRYVFTVTSLVHPLITDTFLKKKRKEIARKFMQPQMCWKWNM